MSLEIEKLKLDIEVLERIDREGGYANRYAVDPLLGQMRNRLELLEEKAKDPHQEAKEVVNIWETHGSKDEKIRKVAAYVKSLKGDITRLTLERDRLQKHINETMPKWLDKEVLGIKENDDVVITN